MNSKNIGSYSIHLQLDCISPFLVCRRYMTHLQKTTFENVVAKSEIVHSEKCFQRFSKYYLVFSILLSCFQNRLLCIVLKTSHKMRRLFRLGTTLFLNAIYLLAFLHIDAFWRLCSRRLFENIVTKEEIAQNVQFLLLPQCFPLFVIGYPFNYKDFLFFDKTRSKSSAAELPCEGKGYSCKKQSIQC